MRTGWVSNPKLTVLYYLLFFRKALFDNAVAIQCLKVNWEVLGAPRRTARLLLKLRAFKGINIYIKI